MRKNVLFHFNFKMKIEWHFRCTDYCHSFFIFKKNVKRNTVRISFFIFTKEFKIELLKQIKINFMILFTSMIYMLFKSKFVPSPLRFSAVQQSRGHQKSAVQKTVDVFQCLFYWLLLLIRSQLRHISRSSHHGVFSQSHFKSYS